MLSVISIWYSIMYLVGGMDQLWILPCLLMWGYRPSCFKRQILLSQHRLSNLWHTSYSVPRCLIPSCRVGQGQSWVESSLWKYQTQLTYQLQSRLSIPKELLNLCHTCACNVVYWSGNFVFLYTLPSTTWMFKFTFPWLLQQFIIQI